MWDQDLHVWRSRCWTVKTKMRPRPSCLKIKTNSQDQGETKTVMSEDQDELSRPRWDQDRHVWKSRCWTLKTKMLTVKTKTQPSHKKKRLETEIFETKITFPIKQAWVVYFVMFGWQQHIDVPTSGRVTDNSSTLLLRRRLQYAAYRALLAYSVRQHEHDQKLKIG